jgi:hypothetical protein
MVSSFQATLRITSYHSAMYVCVGGVLVLLE